MSTVLMHGCSGWHRQRMDPSARCMAVGAEDLMPCHPDALAELVKKSHGVVLQVDGRTFHISVAGRTKAYLNAGETPTSNVVQLRNHDRITYHDGHGIVRRIWLVADAGEARCYDGTPTGLACGYCDMPLAAGEALVTCPACDETIHEDCLAHARESCPRCGAEIVQSEAEWLPEGFAAEEEDAGYEW